MLSAQTLHVAINRSCDEVYAFLSQPENFPLWAKGLANSLRREDEDWVADTPQGRIRIRFSAPNDFGVLDHWVTLPDGGVVYVPLRAARQPARHRGDLHPVPPAGHGRCDVRPRRRAGERRSAGAEALP